VAAVADGLQAPLAAMAEMAAAELAAAVARVQKLEEITALMEVRILAVAVAPGRSARQQAVQVALELSSFVI
jgi:hypothetical protein